VATVATPESTGTPAPLAWLIAFHAVATVAAAVLVALLIEGPDRQVSRPRWLASSGRAVTASLVLLALYGIVTWLLCLRRRAGLVIAAILACAGLAARFVGVPGSGSLVINAGVLLLVSRRSVRAAVH
jgi:hypothetical protein